MEMAEARNSENFEEDNLDDIDTAQTIPVMEGHYENPDLQQKDDAPCEDVANTQNETDLQSDKRRNRRVGVAVGLLCAVLGLLNIAVPVYLYQCNMVERQQLLTSFDELQNRHNNLTEQKDRLQTSFDQLQTRCDQLQNRLNQQRVSLCELRGWETFDGHLYYISTEKKTWVDARQWCRDRQSDLIVIKSKEEQGFVERVQQTVWLGLTDRDREGEFKWVDGTPLTTPTYWASYQPDNYGLWYDGKSSEDCVEYYVGVIRPEGWNDLPCIHRNRWICEKALY